MVDLDKGPIVGPPKGRKARKEKSVKTLGLASACLIAAVAVLCTVSPSTANAVEDPYTPCETSSADTDGDCRADSAENASCVSVEETTRRGGMVGKDGCAVSFLQCFRARPDAYYTCGDAGSVWDNPGVRSFLDGLAWVVDGKGVRHQLEPTHLPLWEGGTSGGWKGCSGDGTLHAGEFAFVGGKKVKTGLPSQTPPFCHSVTMDVTEKRNTIRVVETRVETRVEIDEATRSRMVAAEEDAKKAGEGVTRVEERLDRMEPDVKQLRRDVYSPDTGLVRTREEAAADRGRLKDVEADTEEVRNEVFEDDGSPKLSRIDSIDGEVRSLRREVRERSFILEVGYAGNGLGYVHDSWTRPFLHGPLVRLGYRRDFGKMLVIARAYGTPYNVGASGFSAGGHAGLAWRVFRLVVRRDALGIISSKWMEPTHLHIGFTAGGGGWAVGAYTPGSAGYADVSGGGVDVDGIVLVDIPKTVMTVSGSFGVRIHAVKYGKAGDTLLPDPTLGIALQLRL